MNPDLNPNWFADAPLTRINHEEDNQAYFDKKLNDPDSLLVPLWRGDPLVIDETAGFLSVAARSEFPADASIVLLGEKKGRTYFAIDASGAGPDPTRAPFADLGEYLNMRAAAGVLDREETAIFGHGRWLFEWHRKHEFCAVCGTRSVMANGGAKRNCPSCGTEHFPRTDPVAIVLAIHGDACLLGRGPEWPPGFVSALAGYIEPAETPEHAARRELFEEAGIHLTDIRYQFSQPWPFPTTLMMGFIADAKDRALTLDTREIAEAHWVDRSDINRMRQGEAVGGLFLPPPFTIARQLIDRWAREKAAPL